jgi:hypothetical protein
MRSKNFTGKRNRWIRAVSIELRLGCLASETAHRLSVQGMSATGQGMRGLEMHLCWRTGESFAYEMQFPRDQPATIWCRYFN